MVWQILCSVIVSDTGRKEENKGEIPYLETKSGVQHGKGGEKGGGVREGFTISKKDAKHDGVISHLTKDIAMST